MKSVILNSIIVVILILGICTVIGGTKEMFVSGAEYPRSVESPILDNSVYPYKKSIGLSKESYKSQSSLYPKWAVGSYEQKTNNVRYHNTPCNGTASPAEFCGGIYDKKEIKKPNIKAPEKYCKYRVNYYC
jgi:hypothetical protein